MGVIQNKIVTLQMRIGWIPKRVYHVNLTLGVNGGNTRGFFSKNSLFWKGPYHKYQNQHDGKNQHDINYFSIMGLIIVEEST